MKNSWLVFIVVCLLIAGCAKRPAFQIIKHDSIIRITDTVSWAFPDELTLQTLAECDSTNKVHLRDIDSIKASFLKIRPITKVVYREKIINKIDTIKINTPVIVQKEATKNNINGYFLAIIALCFVLLLIKIFK